MLYWVEIRRLIWSLKKSHLFALRNSRLLLQIALNQYPSTLWRCGWSVLQHLAESEQSITLYTSEFILRSVSSSSTGSHTWPVHNSLLTPCLTDHGVGPWVVPFLFYTFFPSFWYKMTLVSSLQSIFFMTGWIWFSGKIWSYFLILSVTSSLQLVALFKKVQHCWFGHF